MGKNLLLVSDLPQDKAFATSVAIRSGLSLIAVSNAAEAADVIENEETGVTFVDARSKQKYQDFEASIQNRMGLFSEKLSPNTMHYISELDLDQIQYLIKSPIFGNFISGNYGEPKEAGDRYGLLIRSCLGDRAFGLEKLLSPKAKIEHFEFSRTNQKKDGVEAVKNFLVGAKFKHRMATAITNSVDELVMNAMFDAPVDEMGRQVYASTPRNTVMDLPEGKGVDMYVGFDGEYVAITAVDYCGSLDKTRLFSHLSKRYVEEEYKVRTTVAGAGIGLATVFRSGGSFFFVTESQARTEVTVFFRRANNYRQFKDQFRFISTQFYF